ncbi:NAD(P)H-quinone oxidoreductase subunit S, chloroplastic [Ziziphus jujuba]|uniref:NAD(P)H-quinone oxidoreductase subunit S, chloroplastic n=1 Tax=Ziziphus jujuba TaxID=326968 RepID=A0A6P4B2E8_ZIZJJ|nr:NAD(P)H-quinone oxidoreductase subunit S, chloroplastic [Ziziphus jujuba]
MTTPWPELKGKSFSPLSLSLSLSLFQPCFCKIMATNLSLPSFQGSLLKSHFLGKAQLSHRPYKPTFTFYKPQSTQYQGTCAKFNLFEILGGRGLCNGEEGIQKELTRNIEEQAPPASVNKEEKSPASVNKEEKSSAPALSTTEAVPEDGFEKELMGLTGGFPGGEKGLQLFIEKNPPPEKPTAASSGNVTEFSSGKKPKAPELPLLLPGMIAIVSNPNSPYYMYCGIVQRITDGKAGVLFEGGNWDRLITFRLDELERREKGPPGKNPKSAVLEPLLEKDA